MKVIINADDCGFNHHVNQRIGVAIDAGKITSTTIMANMSDLNGALELYDRYHDRVSFGAHLNLTEGSPIIASKPLLEFGFYIEKDDSLFFDGKKVESYHYKHLPNYICEEVYKELAAQIKIIQEGGVKISHLDSHHHIHTSLSLIGVMAQISKDYNLPKVRRIRNYVSSPISFIGRQAWTFISMMNNRNYIFTDYFAIFKEYFANPALKNIKESDVLELMIHPGHQMKSYQNEEQLMLDIDYPKVFELINYNDL